MRWYKILARILLMLSVIGFTLAAPVVVREHEVRISGVDAAKDRTATWPLRRDSSNKWLANTTGQTNALPMPRSSDSGHSRKQEPRQHNRRPRTGPSGPPEPSNQGQWNPDNAPLPSPHPGPGSTSPRPTSQALTDEPDPLNPSSPHGNTDLNPSPHKGQGPTDDSHASNPASPSLSRPLSPRPGPGSTSAWPTSQVPTDEPDPLNPSSPHGNTDLNPSPHQGQGPTDDTHASNLASPSASRPLSLSSSDDDVDMNFGPQSSSQKFKPLSELVPIPEQGAPPPVAASDGSPQTTSSSDSSHSSDSWVPKPEYSTTEESSATSLDQSSTDESRPPTPPTDNNPPPRAKRPHPEDHESGSSLLKILRGGKFYRRFSGSGALNATRDLQGTINSRA